jgi:hypothetical protein
MYTLLIYSGGRQVDALLLSASADRLRLVVPGRGETEELQWIEDRWVSESGAVVELGALIAVSTVRASILRREEPMLVCAAS